MCIPPLQSMEEEYVQCIHEFINVNSILKSPSPPLFTSKDKEEVVSCIQESIEDEQREELIAVHSTVMLSHSKD